MKTVLLTNPEQAQQVFFSNGWTDQADYFIKCVWRKVIRDIPVILKEFKTLHILP
jgi:hypothetical protein